MESICWNTREQVVIQTKLFQIRIVVECWNTREQVVIQMKFPVDTDNEESVDDTHQNVRRYASFNARRQLSCMEHPPMHGWVMENVIFLLLYEEANKAKQMRGRCMVSATQ